MVVYYAQYESPVGKLLLACTEEGLTGLWIDRDIPPDALQQEHPVLVSTMQWLDGYFRGEAGPVPVPLAPEGTAFQKQVWEILLTIPCGKACSYGRIAREMAQRLGKKKMSAQAVGGAVGRNPISILIPCHRVVGSKGQLTGYAAGLEKKVWLLKHEGWHISEENLV